jgi:hypothetical protein
MHKNLDTIIKSTRNVAIVTTKEAKEANLNNEMCAVILTKYEQRGHVQFICTVNKRGLKNRER